MEAAVLALVAVLLVDPASELTLLVLQLQPDCSPEETLGVEEQRQVGRQSGRYHLLLYIGERSLSCGEWILSCEVWGIYWRRLEPIVPISSFLCIQSIYNR